MTTGIVAGFAMGLTTREQFHITSSIIVFGIGKETSTNGTKWCEKIIFDQPLSRRAWLGIGEFNVHEITKTKTMMELPI
jgi:hypothetical protein